MDDSLKYGIPAGLASFMMLYFLRDADATIQVLRWLGVSVALVTIGLYFIRRRNRAYFPFGFAFLSAFNLSIVMILIQAILMVILQDFIIPSPVGAEMNTKWVFYNVFMESMGFLAICLFVVLLASFFFKRSNKRTINPNK